MKQPIVIEVEPQLKLLAETFRALLDDVRRTVHSSHGGRAVAYSDVEGLIGSRTAAIGPDLVLTNHHVIKRALVSESAIDAEKVEIWFDHKKVDGAVQPGREVRLAGDGLVAWRPASQSDRDDGDGLPADDELDYALLRIAEPIGAVRGWLELEADEWKPRPGGWLTILQHPGYEAQQAVLEPKGILRLNDNGTRLRHRVNTEPGSSGSPVFDFEWRFVALHHAGYATKTKRYNQAIPVHLIAADLRARGIYPFATDVVNPKSVALNRFEPTMIVLCADSESTRAAELMKDATTPPTYAARIGNDPPARAGDETVGVFLGGPGEVDPAVGHAVEALRSRQLPVITVVDDVTQFLHQTPESLHEPNRLEWKRGEGVPGSLTRRIRQRLGLLVNEGSRSVFISYKRDDIDRDVVRGLKRELMSCGYEVFCDVEDLTAGETVPERIDEKLSKTSRKGSNAVLYLETEHAHGSGRVYEELKRGLTMGLGMVVVQLGEVRDRLPLIGHLPLHRIAEPTELPANAGRIASWLDREIAENENLSARISDYLVVVARGSKKDAAEVSVETLVANMLEVRYSAMLSGVALERTVLMWNARYRPSATNLPILIDRYDRDKDRLFGAIFVYDAPEVRLRQDELKLIDALRGKRPVWCIERRDIETKLPRILRGLQP